MRLAGLSSRLRIRLAYRAVALQHQLAELVETASPGSHRSKQSLAFSVCTEGPHLELWAHYTTWQKGIRNYNMSILKTCHTSILGGVIEFLMAMENVMKWARMDFASDVVKQLV